MCRQACVAQQRAYAVQGREDAQLLGRHEQRQGRRESCARCRGDFVAVNARDGGEVRLLAERERHARIERWWVAAVHELVVRIGVPSAGSKEGEEEARILEARARVDVRRCVVARRLVRHGPQRLELDVRRREALAVDGERQGVRLSDVAPCQGLRGGIVRVLVLARREGIQEARRLRHGLAAHARENDPRDGPSLERAREPHGVVPAGKSALPTCVGQDAVVQLERVPQVPTHHRCICLDLDDAQRGRRLFDAALFQPKNLARRRDGRFARHKAHFRRRWRRRRRCAPQRLARCLELVEMRDVVIELIKERADHDREELTHVPPHVLRIATHGRHDVDARLTGAAHVALRLKRIIDAVIVLHSHIAIFSCLSHVKRPYAMRKGVWIRLRQHPRHTLQGRGTRREAEDAVHDVMQLKGREVRARRVVRRHERQVHLALLVHGRPGRRPRAWHIGQRDVLVRAHDTGPPLKLGLLQWCRRHQQDPDLGRRAERRRAAGGEGRRCCHGRSTTLGATPRRDVEATCACVDEGVCPRTDRLCRTATHAQEVRTGMLPLVVVVYGCRTVAGGTPAA